MNIYLDSDIGRAAAGIFGIGRASALHCTRPRAARLRLAPVPKPQGAPILAGRGFRHMRMRARARADARARAPRGDGRHVAAAGPYPLLLLWEGNLWARWGLFMRW